MSQAENYARDTYALKDMYFKGRQAYNKPAEEGLKTWWNKLQEFEGQPGYGAIPIDWADIWDRAQEKVRYTYWGDPGGAPGAAGKVKASAARRGVSDSPALQTELSRMGMREGADIRDLASRQALEESEYGEAGRQNWLSSLERLTSRRIDPGAAPMPMYLPNEKKGEWDWGGMASGAVSGAATGTTIMPGWGTLIGGVLGAGAGGAQGLLDTTSHDDMNLGGALNAYASGSPYSTGKVSGKAGAAKDSGGIMDLLGGGGSGGLDLSSIMQLLSSVKGGAQ